MTIREPPGSGNHPGVAPKHIPFSCISAFGSNIPSAEVQQQGAVTGTKENPAYIAEGVPATPSRRSSKKPKIPMDEEEVPLSLYQQMEKAWNEHQKFILGTFVDFPLNLWDTNEKGNPGRDLDPNEVAKKVEQLKKMPWNPRGPPMVMMLTQDLASLGLSRWSPDMSAEEKQAMEPLIFQTLKTKAKRLQSISGQHRLHALHQKEILDRELGIVTVFAPLPDTPERQLNLQWIGKYLQVKDESISITDFADRMKWVWSQHHATKAAQGKGLTSIAWASIWTQLEKQTNPQAHQTAPKTMKTVSGLIRTNEDVFDIFWRWMKWALQNQPDSLSISMFKGMTAQMIPFLAWMIAAEECKLPLADFRSLVKNLGTKKDVQSNVKDKVDSILKDLQDERVEEVRSVLEKKIASSEYCSLSRITLHFLEMPGDSRVVADSRRLPGSRGLPAAPG